MPNEEIGGLNLLSGVRCNSSILPTDVDRVVRACRLGFMPVPNLSCKGNVNIATPQHSDTLKQFPFVPSLVLGILLSLYVDATHFSFSFTIIGVGLGGMARI